MNLLRKKGFWMALDILNDVYHNYLESKIKLSKFYELLIKAGGNYNLFIRKVRDKLISAGIIIISNRIIQLTKKGKEFIDLIHMVEKRLK